ncbi:hypothetical protein AGMMS50267_04330 [Spirochaetia bacterium]|nr:hypothetical protein AGMMS50267_04330 [Spirochaetia bacterium]
MVYEHWTAGFTKPFLAHFDIESENAYNANVQSNILHNALTLSLKKPNCLAWVENL